MRRLVPSRTGDRPRTLTGSRDALARLLDQRERPLGTFVHARSGDKGGDANLGLWVRHDGSPSYDARVAWLLATVTPDFVRELLPETRDLEVEVHALPNLGGVNVVVHGLLGGAWPPRPGSTRRPRASASGRGRGTWTFPRC